MTLPELITWAGAPNQVKLNHFTLKELCGFKPSECQDLVLSYPDVYMVEDEEELEMTAKFLHNEVGYPHETLVKFPTTLLTNHTANRPRLLFLKKLNRDQFDPTLPNYVSPKSMVLTTDQEFCKDVAKISLGVFNDFLKTT